MGAQERIAEAREELHEDADGNPVAPSAGDLPVYDERGNVRPRGTKGAKPMSYEQRVAIAQGIKAEKRRAVNPPRRRRGAK